MTRKTVSSLKTARVAVVIPCYRVERKVAAVVATVPSFVSLIVAVDDGCPYGSGQVIRDLNDPRVVVVTHERNQGVGAAVMTGYRECLRRGAEIVAKMDGDGQMDPACLRSLIAPLVSGEADYTKGNRWTHAANPSKMPFVRRMGNLGLSFLSKLASGHWKMFDPCNGYTAIHAAALRQLPEERVARDYFFEISMLVELGILGAKVRDIPMAAIYGDETSSLRIGRVLRTFPPRLASSLARRVWARHFVGGFGPIGLFLVSGGLMIAWATLFGGWAWLESLRSGVPATAGTVMLAAMPFLAGFELLLQALVMDITATQPSGVRDTQLASSVDALAEAAEEPFFVLEQLDVEPWELRSAA